MDSGICTYLDWDSQFFDMRIAKYAGHCLTMESAEQAAHWCRDRQIDCLYFLADAADPHTVAVAEANQYRLVDVRLTFHRLLSHQHDPQPAVRPFRTSDAARLRLIARASHRDSRFYFDPRFPEARCDALYETWIERSFTGWAAAVLVAGTSGEAGGYVSCHLEPSGIGSIGLLAVAPECRGQSMGTHLTLAALAWFRDHGMREATVVTQGRNIASQRLYQKCGFLTASVQLWYHKWFAAGSLP